MRPLLTVDDDPEIRRIIRLGLAADYSVFEAWDKASALAAFRDAKPGIILLDLNLPDCDGIELLEALKAAGSDAFVIMLTGIEDLEAARRSLELGADEYITKPFDMEYLKGVLRDRAGRREPNGDRPPWRVGE
ncbi:MAG: response regulator [Elusimicrobiota bacterium]|jgi:DNA-binding response OmpR family regulator